MGSKRKRRSGGKGERETPEEVDVMRHEEKRFQSDLICPATLMANGISRAEITLQKSRSITAIKH